MRALGWAWSLTVLLLGCAKPWSNPMKDEQELNADSAECSAQAGQAMAGGRDDLGFGWRAAYGKCMREKGWKNGDE
jgi:hypothetical protein